jgi:hypothetical protein
MAHPTLAVRRESGLLAFGIKLMTKLAIRSRANRLSDLSPHSEMQLVREVEQDRARLIVVWKTPEVR